MEVVIVSDTHGDTDFIQKIVNTHPHASYFLHAGDSLLMDYEIKPFITVRGNCDFHNNHLSRIITIGNHRIYLFHGDRFYLEKENLSKLCKDNECDIIIHGHTHIAYYEFYEGVHIICPGSIVFPRGGFPSYAVLNVDEQVTVKIEKYGT